MTPSSTTSDGLTVLQTGLTPVYSADTCAGAGSYAGYPFTISQLTELKTESAEFHPDGADPVTLKHNKTYGRYWEQRLAVGIVLGSTGLDESEQPRMACINERPLGFGRMARDLHVWTQNTELASRGEPSYSAT